MKREDITFYLALWGAVTSTLLFLFDVLKFSKEISGKLKTLIIKVSEVEIDLKIINISHRPLTIISYDILYAANDDYYQILKSHLVDQPIKINESETYSIKISRKELKESVKENKIEQRYYHELKIRINTSTCIFTSDIPITESIINDKFYEPAGKYIAADIYIGFAQQESFYYPVGTKIMMK